MMRRLKSACALSAFCLLAAPAMALDGWHLQDTVKIPGKGSAWDYLALDGTHNHLFIGHRKEGLQVFDLATKTVVKTIAGTESASSNGATLAPEFDLGISNNENGTIIPFKLSTLEAGEPIKLGEELDTSHYDPASKRIVVNMASGADGTDLVVLEAPSLKQVGIIKVPTKKPEHAEADGAGNFYLAARDTEMVYRLDTKSLAVTASWPTPGCGQTNSVALDAANKRLMLGCRGNASTKPSFAVMNVETGAIVFSAEVGGGNDGVAFDAQLKRIFLTNGVNAVMNIFEQKDADHYAQVEALGTQAGVRSLALDPKTKTIYSVTAEGTADYSKKITTSVSPYYANTFFPDTFAVLTYGKK
ncbi:MAG: YncE family protein [Bosea sp.]|uniref:YncE family protein n=2 Tax=Bosea sp. (in: a-proteobacteria) TaxID=1871050 RepID=UPI0031FE750C|nr:YncE family protein [Bosea sp. (in: a-proteobacteria)]